MAKKRLDLGHTRAKGRGRACVFALLLEYRRGPPRQSKPGFWNAEGSQRFPGPELACWNRNKERLALAQECPDRFKSGNLAVLAGARMRADNILSSAVRTQGRQQQPA